MHTEKFNVRISMEKSILCVELMVLGITVFQRNRLSALKILELFGFIRLSQVK